MHPDQVRILLDSLFSKDYAIPFLEDDPVQIPHRYHRLQDKEIVAFWTAMLAWGQRTTIINKSNELFALMDNQPYDFILNLDDARRKHLSTFKHRTFNYTDTLYFVEYLHRYYQEHESLEDAFLIGNADFDAKTALINFHNQFFQYDFAPQRTRKHVATPAGNSACKRINLFLKWMVRHDPQSGDMGVWQRIPQAGLILPLDVHVMKSAQALGIVAKSPVNWKLAQQVTDYLKVFDNSDPVKYDYALFIYSRYAKELLIK